MAKQRKQLPRKGHEAIKFIEQNAEVVERRHEGSHVIMRVRGPKGETIVNVNVHGSGQELSIGVWHKTRKALIRIGVLLMIVGVFVTAFYLMGGL